MGNDEMNSNISTLIKVIIGALKDTSKGEDLKTINLGIRELRKKSLTIQC